MAPWSEGAIDATKSLERESRFNMLPVRPSNDDEPGRPGEEFLTSKNLLLLIIAGGITELYVQDPKVGVAIMAAITALAMLWKMIS